MTEDDKIIAAYAAGVLTVVVVIPAMFVAAVKWVPPFREAVRAKVVNTVDSSVAESLPTLPADVRAVVGIVDAYLRVSQSTNLSRFVHQSASVPAGDYVISRIVSL